MSTFKGFVSEFPDIRIDYFRTSPNHPPPLACFLSHVHTDHLQGLESLKSPFIYCTPATREILLRLEKYPHRLNFARGVLETRMQTFRHLKSLLKTIPLQTPTVVQLAPGNEIQVTLFDANHCVGACMFLIQSSHSSAAGSHAVLYTGDVRAETWWIDSLVRNPVLLPYTLGRRRLDRLYLDTTFASKAAPYRTFPSKAEGLRELLEKVEKYPVETLFYYEAWTFGYENVWLALSAALGSQIHLDRYRYGLYKSLKAPYSGSTPQAPEAAALMGFACGNHEMRGCLTPDHSVRIHSCERGTSTCPLVDGKIGKEAVRIVPVITRMDDGTELGEMGLGGGKGDLDQVHELEITDPGALMKLLTLCTSKVEDREVLDKMFQMLKAAIEGDSGRIRLDAFQGEDLPDDITLEKLVEVLRIAATTADDSPCKRLETEIKSMPSATTNASNLPSTITFPYSRHSSYDELCALVKAFNPRDVYPCTVDEETWLPELSMRALFGHLCSGSAFLHDQEMLEKHADRTGLNLTHSAAQGSERPQVGYHVSQPDQHTPEMIALVPPSSMTNSVASRRSTVRTDRIGTCKRRLSEEECGLEDPIAERKQRAMGWGQQTAPLSSNLVQDHKSAEDSCQDSHKFHEAAGGCHRTDPPSPQTNVAADMSSPIPANVGPTTTSVGVGPSQIVAQARMRGLREWAYDAATGSTGISWFDFGGLASSKRKSESQELGEEQPSGFDQADE